MILQDLIDKLDLKKHPEGGYYHENYRAQEVYEKDALPGRYTGNRTTGTSIYFLLTSDEHSKFHKLASDEIWHFHLGGSAKIYMISPKGKLIVETIGKNIFEKEKLQVVIKRDHWFAAEVTKGDYILVGCTVSPGFEFEDFQLGNRDDLSKSFPNHVGLIERLT